MNQKIYWGLFLILSISFLSCNDDKDLVTPTITQDLTIPHSPNPSNGGIEMASSLKLSWECTEATSYSIYFDKVNPPLEIIKTNSTEKFVDNVIASGNRVVYYWKVVAKFGDDLFKESPIWHFTTGLNTTTQPGYILKSHSVATAPPNNVKMLFHVRDLNNKGIDDLTKDNFEISEDGNSISIFESKISITKRENNPFKIKTVLMLDNSTSIGDDSNNLQLLKDAAKNFVDNMTEQQEVALYKFSNTPEKILDFTSNKNTLRSAIDNMVKGFATTNLYGAVIEGVSQWEDKIELNNIVQGSLVLFTDGNDTQGSKTLGEALNAIGEKSVYTVGLGNEIEAEILMQIGNQGAYSISELSELNQIFIKIQQQISTYASSYYWMDYSSPKRGDSEHTIYLRIKNNEISSVAEGIFSSSGFYDPNQGIYLNSSFAKPLGDSIFTLVSGGSPIEINAVSYGIINPPVYSWGTNSSLTVDELNPPENSNVKIYANSSAPAGNVKINIADTENILSKTLSFNIIR
jgi:von Willebrand factor type A domain